jgi:hypothetical protein
MCPRHLEWITSMIRDTEGWWRSRSPTGLTTASDLDARSNYAVDAPSSQHLAQRIRRRKDRCTPAGSRPQILALLLSCTNTSERPVHGVGCSSPTCKCSGGLLPRACIQLQASNFQIGMPAMPDREAAMSAGKT